MKFFAVLLTFVVYFIYLTHFVLLFYYLKILIHVHTYIHIYIEREKTNSRGICVSSNKYKDCNVGSMPCINIK